MKFWFKKRTRAFNKLLVCLILFGYFFITLANPVLALTPDQQEAANQAAQQNTETANQISATTTNERSIQQELEEGQVLDIVNCIGDPIDCVRQGVGDIVNDIAGLPGKIAKEIGGFIVNNLFDLVAKVILYVVHIFASILGVHLDKEDCDKNPPDAKECVDAFKALAEIDPLFAMDTSAFEKLNLFTIADGSIASVYSSFPKDNTKTYLVNTFNESVLGAKTAYAQGLGIELINQGPVQKAWQLISNLAYVGMVIILVVIGFMVMLRKRLDPRTVVSATNSLPKVGVALVLIVFSFALSGLFFDLIYVMYDLVRDWAEQLPNNALFQASSGSLNIPIIGQVVIGELFWLPFFTFFSDSIIKPAFFISFLSTAIVGGPAVVAVVLLIGYFIFEIIVRLSLFVIAIILFWTVFMRYVTMIVLTIFSPIFFLVGALPGFESATINWFKRMFASALVFPTVLALVYLALSFIQLDASRLLNWVPFGAIPGVGAENFGAPPPVQGGGFFLEIPTLIGLGFILFALKIPGFIDDLLGLKDPLGRGGLGAGLLFASVAVPLAGLKEIGNIGKGFSGTKDFVNYAVMGKTQVGRMAFSKGYNTTGGTRATYNPATGNYETPSAMEAGGFQARVYRIVNRLVAGPTPGTSSLPKADRDREVMNILTRLERQGRFPATAADVNPADFRRELGDITDADLNEWRRRNS